MPNLTTLRKALLKPSVKLRYKFLYDTNGDGTPETDYTDLVLENGIGTIRRDVNLSAGKALVTVNNSGGWWNFLRETNNALGSVAAIQIYVSGDEANYLTLFQGTVRYPEWEGANVTLTLKDHNARFLNAAVGSNETPYTFWASQTWDADEVVWRLLTTLGGLDSVTSPANTDIDYARFSDWRDNHIRSEGYEIKGLPKGQTIAQLLMLVCQMTHSYIWVNNNGKVDFAPPFQPGYAYSEGNTGKKGSPGQGRNFEMPDDKIINNAVVRYGHNQTTGTWVGKVTKNQSTSITKFGQHDDTIEGRIFWHMTQTSATADRDAIIDDYAFPLRMWELTAGVPALMEDLGRQITITDTQKGVSNAAAYVESIIYDLDAMDVTIKAREPWA